MKSNKLFLSGNHMFDFTPPQKYLNTFYFGKYAHHRTGVFKALHKLLLQYMYF